jgi:hypothetical protein
MRRISAIRIVLVVMGLCFGSLLGTGTASAADSSVEIGDALVIERDAGPVVRPRPAPCGRRFNASVVKVRCSPRTARV